VIELVETMLVAATEEAIMLGPATEEVAIEEGIIILETVTEVAAIQ
jgi:hypothetical protein